MLDTEEKENISRLKHTPKQKKLMHQFREAKGQNRRSLKGTYGSVIERILTSTKAKLTFLVSITLLTRLYAFLQTQVITYDGMLYVESAKLFSEGKYEEIPFLFNLYSFLLFLVHKLLGDWELSGQVVSVTLSILTVIPIFLLGRSLYNEKIGWLSSIFFIFLPDSLRYSSEVLRDPTSWFFMVLTLWLVWVGMQKNRFALFGAASLSAGLGSMNRAEGFVIWCALALFLAFQRTAGISIKNRGLNLAIFVLLFPLFLSSFLFLPRSNASQKALTKMPLYPTYFVKNYASVALQPQDHIVAIGDKVYKSLPIASKNFLELASRYRMILVASEVVYKFIKSSNLLILLIMLGLWKRKTEGFESSDGYLLCIWGALFGISYLYALQNNYFSTRHGLTLVIPCLFFAGHGLIFAVESLSRGMNRVAPQWTFLKKYLFHILTSILILIFAIQALSIGRTDKVGIKRIGLWLKERGYQGSVMMGTVQFSRLAFYADGEFLEMPDSWENVIDSIHRNGVKIVIIDSCTIEQDCPGFLANFSRVDHFPLRELSGKGEGCVIKIFGVY